jgi:HD-GYP domain-containing protein (c-di-GMP phosphodiesterase class II)
LKENAGIMFDPNIVEIFLNMIEEQDHQGQAG